MQRRLSVSLICSALALGLGTYACSNTPGILIDSGKSYDQDGDGVADDLGEAVDKDGDGKPDAYEDGYAVDTDGDGEPDAVGYDTDGDGIIDALDTDGDGKPDRFSTKAPTKKPSGGSGGSGPGIIIGEGGANGSGGTTGNGTPEVCDGIDNDEDGIIDNVDAGGDGICDCLNIGTIGRIGPWGEGNIFTTWLNERSPRPATEIGDNELTEEELAGLDVIVVLRADTAELSDTPAHHEFTNAEVGAFGDWVRAGGGVMTTIGYQDDEAAEIVNVNRLLAPFDAGYDPDDLDLGGFVTTWNEHPISNGVSNIRTDNGVSVLAEEGTVVAVGNGDRPAMVVHQAEDGRIIVWGDEWITYNSEWEDVDDQQIELLWINMIKWLSPPKKCQVPIPPILVK